MIYDVQRKRRIKTNIPSGLNDKASKVAKTFKINKLDAFDIFSRNTPLITNIEIIKQPRSKKRFKKITFEQLFEMK